MGIIESYLAKKSFDGGLRLAKKILQKVDSSITTEVPDLIEAIESHIAEVKNWAEEVSFGDLRSPKKTQSIFVQLDCYVMPRHRRISQHEVIERIRFQELFKEEVAPPSPDGETTEEEEKEEKERPGPRHYLFLGGPGAGKTTSMKHLCNLVLFDESFAQESINYPILIRLRELNRVGNSRSKPLADYICKAINLNFNFSHSLNGKADSKLEIKSRSKLDAICSIFDQTKALLILDGFDEISDVSQRDRILGEIRLLMLKAKGFTVVVTCRTGELFVSLDKASVFELCELGKNQILDFARKWLGSDVEAQRFFDQVDRSPFSDSAIKPLTLAHLCALYERVGSIPDKPKTVYRKIFNLLLTDWDEQRSVKRNSKFAGFDSDRKYEFLSHIAYLLTVEERDLVFSKRALLRIYGKIHLDFALPESESLKVIQELESHTGLFLQCGFDTYEFVHKSIQEFLSAEYLVRLPRIPKEREVLWNIPNELAIAISISSNPSEYMVDLIFERLQNAKLPVAFMSVFVTRLLQEKVDFRGSDIVILSLMTLYTWIVRGVSAGEEQLNLFMFDELVEEFEVLIDSVARSNPDFALEKFYRFENLVHVVGAAKVGRFVRFGDHGVYQLPSDMLVRDSFAERIGCANLIK